MLFSDDSGAGVVVRSGGGVCRDRHTLSVLAPPWSESCTEGSAVQVSVCNCELLELIAFAHLFVASLRCLGQALRGLRAA